MNFHGSEQLLGATDGQWPFVRANLDGFWGDFSSEPDGPTAIANTIELTRKVSGRKLIVEHHIASPANGRCQAFPPDHFHTTVEASASDIHFDRVAAALYAGNNPDCWGVNGGVSSAIEHFQLQQYDTVYTLYQPQNLERDPKP